MSAFYKILENKTGSIS